MKKPAKARKEQSASEATPPALPRTCLIDTNILISLGKPDDDNHKSVSLYVKAFKQAGVIFYLSPIVETEFRQGKGDIANVILLLGPQQVRRISYDHKDAEQAKALLAKRETSAHKDIHIIDMMIAGQMKEQAIDALLTCDRKLISFLARQGIRAIDANVPYSTFEMSGTSLYGDGDMEA